MKYLVDTNAWIALFEDAPVLTERAAEIMESAENECYVSLASVWEAAIKVGLRKLKLPYDLRKDLPRLLEENGFRLLPIEVEDALDVSLLEAIHGDPFDRMQVVQALRRGFTVISRNAVFDRYEVKRVWGGGGEKAEG